jgi:hypothetical protein
VCETWFLALRDKQVEEGAGIKYSRFSMSHLNGTYRWSNITEIRGVQRRNEIKIEWKCSKRTNLICNKLSAAQSGMRCSLKAVVGMGGMVMFVTQRSGKHV